MCRSALTWYLNRERGVERQADGLLAPRKLWHNDLILPPKVEPVLRELCGSFEWGHLHEDCPPDRVGRFRLDHDNAHWIGPYDPLPEADPAIDFPEEVPPRVAGKPYPAMAVHTPDGIIQDGFHGGPPLFHISCMYELQPIAPGEGGFVSAATRRAFALSLRQSPAEMRRQQACIPGSHRPGALIGPDKQSPLGAGHVPWGKPPWGPEVDCDVARIEGQPGDCVLLCAPFCPYPLLEPVADSVCRAVPQHGAPGPLHCSVDGQGRAAFPFPQVRAVRLPLYRPSLRLDPARP